MNLYRRCLMILADGARADVFTDLLGRGKLPAIGELLPTVREGVTAFPSTTGPAYLPYLTGCYPGTCNVPGIRWFDRGTKQFRSYVGAETFFMNRDIDRSVTTLFEKIPNSFSIFNSVSRGARHNPTWFSRIWFWYYAHLTDHWNLADRAAAAKTLRALGHDPEFLFVVFPGIDEHSHLSSPFHPEAIQSYLQLDRTIGKIVGKLKRQGSWEETALFIVSDHGLSETQQHLDLDRFLTELGIETLFYPKVVFRYRYAAANMVSGNGMSHLYLKNGQDWKGRTCWEEISLRPDRLMEKLLERPEIDLIAGQAADGSIVVKSRRGEAVIAKSEIRNPKSETNLNLRSVSDFNIRYSNLAGSDPFGYLPLPTTISDRESLEKTFSTDYPDALAQLVQIFRSERTGDLVLSACKGFDLRDRYEVPEHKSSHGSLGWEHMKVPIVTNVPLPHRPIRSVDIFPTVLQLLGIKSEGNIDGEAVVPQSK